MRSLAKRAVSVNGVNSVNSPSRFAADLPRGGGGGGQPPSAIGLRESIQSGRSFNTSSTAP